MNKTIVVALGGNAILRPREPGTVEQQAANVRRTCDQVAALIEAGYRVVITHGNGPQVGNILIQNEEASAVVPPMPLDVCGAESQGMIGYLIQNAMHNRLPAVPVASVVTQVEVRADDPAFQQPTKPIGPFYTPERARRLMERRGFQMKEDANRGWRRVVPSPEPLQIVERRVIRTLVDTGVVVICGGGGGIPVVRQEGGPLVGVEAVIDKDLAGERLAVEVGAHLYLILTDVEQVYLYYGQPQQQALGRLTAAEMRRYQAEGHFQAGSMGPKVEAACRFVEHGGEMAVITSLDRALAALGGETGTIVVA